METSSGKPWWWGSALCCPPEAKSTKITSTDTEIPSDANSVKRGAHKHVELLVPETSSPGHVADGGEA